MTVVTFNFSKSYRGVTHTQTYYQGLAAQLFTTGDGYNNKPIAHYVGTATLHHTNGTTETIDDRDAFHPEIEIAQNLHIPVAAVLAHAPASDHYDLWQHQPGNPAVMALRVSARVPPPPNWSSYMKADYFGNDETSSGYSADFQKYVAALIQWQFGEGWETSNGITIPRTDATLRDGNHSLGTIHASSAMEPLSFLDIAHVQTIVKGSQHDDTLEGGTLDDKLYGAGGNDALQGAQGDDTLDGGADDDIVDGLDGDDHLLGGTGKDLLTGGLGNDRIEGGDGLDSVYSGKGKDRVDGGSGDDGLSGGAQDDRLVGGDGKDNLVGGTGNDSLRGGNDADNLDGDFDDDELEGGNGNDNLVGGGGVDTLRGQDGNDRLDGGTKSDDLVGGGGPRSVRIHGSRYPRRDRGFQAWQRQDRSFKKCLRGHRHHERRRFPCRRPCR